MQHIEVLIGGSPYIIERRPPPCSPVGQPGVRIDHETRRIIIDAPVPADQQDAILANAVATAWRDVIAQYAADLAQAWDEWSETIEAVDDPQTDPDAEDMGLAFAQFSRLRRLGVRFDPGFVLRMEDVDAKVRKVADDDFDSSDSLLVDRDDSDEDGSDDNHLERDDPDEDFSDRWLDRVPFDLANRDNPNQVAEQRPAGPAAEQPAIHEFVVDDDSMSPDFVEGDRVFYDFSAPCDGDFVVATSHPTAGSKRHRLRRLKLTEGSRRAELVALNPQFPIDVTWDVESMRLGRVIAKQAREFKSIETLRDELASLKREAETLLPGQWLLDPEDSVWNEYHLSLRITHLERTIAERERR